MKEKEPKKYDNFLFYYNPEDKRIFVPKKIPWMGMTVNFARWESWVLLFLVAVVLSLAVLNKLN